MEVEGAQVEKVEVEGCILRLRGGGEGGGG